MAADRLRTSPLDTEHFDSLTMLPDRVRELMEAGYTVDVIDRHLVVNDKPDDDSSGYIVTEIGTTVSPDADAETITLFVCHCSHAHHRVFNWPQVGGPDGAPRPTTNTSSACCDPRSERAMSTTISRRYSATAAR